MDRPTLEGVPTVSSLSEAASAPLATPTISSQLPENTTEHCTICNSLFNLPRSDGQVEKAFILPCSHVFGNICIQRWLETDSLHQDCPICRRLMLYKTCGHVIQACEENRAPKRLREEDMPERCARCRMEDNGLELEGAEGTVEEESRESKRKMEAQERALEGMRRHLPGVFGGMCRNTVQSVDGRIEGLRRDWGREIDAAFRELEEKEGRRKW